MDFKDFFKLLVKYLKVLIIVPVVTMAVAFFLVKRLANDFVSSGQIATGIIDQTGQLVDPVTSNLQESRVNGEFSNLIELMKLKKMMDMVSYQLIIHDLTSNQPFRPVGKYYIHINDPQESAKKASTIEAFKSKLSRLEGLSINDPNENWLNGLLISMNYDERSLRKTIEISRDENSDFISVKATTENPELSAFMVNTLCQGFIAYQTGNLKQNEKTSIQFLSKLLDEKRAALDTITNKLQNYKIANGILNLEEQAKSIQTQLAASADMLTQVQKEADSYRGALEGVKQNFAPEVRKYAEAKVTNLNLEVTNTQDKLRAATDRWVRSDNDPKLSATMDSLKKRLVEQINETSDSYIANPLVGKDDQLKQLRTLQVQYDQARYSKAAVEKQVGQLKAQFNRLVPLNATLNTYNFEIDNASKEYQDVLNKFNAASLQSSISSKLTQVVVAMPEVAQPSKKILLVLLSGVLSFVVCLLVLFIAFYLDDSIKHPLQLAKATNLPVLGNLNRINGPGIDLKKLWDIENRDKMQHFKDQLRAVRFEIDQELNHQKVLAVTSMVEGEGKTLFALSLAYSYAMINKKVLLIDGNFKNPEITHTLSPKMYVEDVFKSMSGYYERLAPAINALGNRGGDITLLEVSDERQINEKLDDLRGIYDVVIIEAPALDAMNKAKEWLLFVNKFVAVFEAGNVITNNKKQVIRYLQATNEKFAGWIVNKSIKRAPKK